MNKATVGNSAEPLRVADQAREMALEINGLTASYHDQPVLRDISAAIAERQLVAVVGPNGAGKSTLLKAILGLIPVDSGSVRVFGENIEEARWRIAYVPQTETVDWDFPVRVEEVVLMGRYPRMGLLRRPSAVDRQAVRDSLEMVGMTGFASRHIRQLSGGQQQRVFLARALAQEADVLLLDEPFAGVDARTEAVIFQLMDELTRKGKTMLVVTHDLSQLQRFDSVMLLNRSLIAYGPVGTTATEENLKRTYGGRLTLLEKAEAELKAGPGYAGDAHSGRH